MRPIVLLRWCLGLVLAGKGLVLVLHAESVLVRAAATAEVVAGLLFLAPRTLALGSGLLLAVLAFVAILHGAEGEWPPAAFLIYAAAVSVVLEDTRLRKQRGP
jgi:hypothetical protein